MEYTVTILPSGHQFTAHENESILESGLRAGYNLKHQCDNGSCGGCRARLVSGAIKPVLNSDFTFSGLEKQQGYFLPCSFEARSDLEIEMGEFTSASDVPYQEITAKARKIDPVREDIIILQLRTPRTKALNFLAGQSATLTLANGTSRTLQVASCPCTGMLLEFHIRRHADEFSDYLFDSLEVGEDIQVSGPCGEFILDEETQRPLLFIAYDTGFAGVKSLIEHAIALDMAQDIHLYRISCHPERDYMHNICRSWEDAIDNLSYETLSSCIPMDCDDETMAANCEQLITAIHQGDRELIHRSDAYLSGTEDILANLGSILVRMGLPEDRLKIQNVE